MGTCPLLGVKRTLQVALDAGYEEMKGREKDRLLNTGQ